MTSENILIGINFATSIYEQLNRNDDIDGIITTQYNMYNFIVFVNDNHIVFEHGGKIVINDTMVYSYNDIYTVYDYVLNNFI